MKSPIRFAFILAMLLEAGNIYFKSSPSDFRYSVGGVSLERLIGNEYAFVHWPGFFVSEKFYNIGYPRVGDLALVAVGYFDIFIFLLIFIYLLRRIGRRRAKRSSTQLKRSALPPDAPAE